MPKETWASYLAWYRQTLGIPVLAETTVGALAWNAAERAWSVPCTTGSEARSIHARRVILSTGIEGSGYWHVPEMIESALPRELYAHTRWPIDFDALRGKRVAVLGCGASAFDNASTALEHGAAEVRMFVRRKALVRVNAYRWAEFVGFLKHTPDLPDGDKWRFIRQILLMGQLPPADTFRRASQHANFHLHFGSAVRTLGLRAGAIAIGTDGGDFEADFLIVGTGFITDLARRPELTEVEGHIARWGDRYAPPASERHDDLARHPYLGPGFEFTERRPGESPHLRYLFNYTFGGLLSMGFGGASISGMKYSIPRLVSGVTSSLFLEDREAHFASLCGYDEKEF
jgi:cation diffusion facilitator CzcD-associated flavoprotein CzcO